MGIFSEINIEQEYGDDLLSESREQAPAPIGETQPPVVVAAPKTEQPPTVAAAPKAEQPPTVAAAPKAEQPEAKAPSDSQPKDSTEADKDEEAKRKAHEEAEAKRKAEWEAKQQKKKAALQEKLDRLAAMSDEEVMVASMKQVSADTEKITRRNMKECVSEHIQTLCLDDPVFARKVMDPRKSMIHCFQYISRKAWEYVQDELKASGIQPGPGQQGYGCDIPDDLCYQWAVDYFNDPDAKEDHVDDEKFVPKPYYGRTTRTTKTKDKKADKKKEAAPKKEEPKKPAKQPSEPAGQITLGGFMMPEAKAG